MNTSEARNRANHNLANASEATTATLADETVGPGFDVPVEDAAEVAHRFDSFRDELQPSTAIGLTLVRRAATLAVRMEKCSERDLATTEERVVRAMAEVELPDGIDRDEAARLTADAGRLAAFDTSREANLARRYEAAAERGFFRALKELRLIEKHVKAIDPARQDEIFRHELGSFLNQSKRDDKLDDKFDALYPELALPAHKNAIEAAPTAPRTRIGAGVDVPITIGRAR